MILDLNLNETMPGWFTPSWMRFTNGGQDGRLTLGYVSQKMICR